MIRSSYNYKNIILKQYSPDKKFVSYAYYLIRYRDFLAGYVICQYRGGKFVDNLGNEIDESKIEKLARLLT